MIMIFCMLKISNDDDLSIFYAIMYLEPPDGASEWEELLLPVVVLEEVVVVVVVGVIPLAVSRQFVTTL
jgi:hypothetical protein